MTPNPNRTLNRVWSPAPFRQAAVPVHLPGDPFVHAADVTSDGSHHSMRILCGKAPQGFKRALTGWNADARVTCPACVVAEVHDA